MDRGIKLGGISEAAYADYRYDVIFNAYKWDPQVSDSNTIAKHVVLMERKTAQQLEKWAEQLSAETMLMEEALLELPEVAKTLGLRKEIGEALRKISGYSRNNHIRLMRFDFHPVYGSCNEDTTAALGWALSEVNSDSPGGLAEASLLPTIASKYLKYSTHHPAGVQNTTNTGCAAFVPPKNVTKALLAAFQAKVKAGGTIALIHATSYADDRQVVQCLGDCFEKAGYRALYAAPDHIVWDNQRMPSLLASAKLDGIVRFFPLEWLADLPKKTKWKEYFNTETPSCNHPISSFTQSKRLPLIWDKLGIELPTWKSLLPPTAECGLYRRNTPSNPWILKPAFGRVGEGITIQGAISEKEIQNIEKAAKKHPEHWIAQRMFHSWPLTTENGEQYHLCIGAFTVEGKGAGFYGRISPYPRMDANAKEIPVMIVESEGKAKEP